MASAVSSFTRELRETTSAPRPTSSAAKSAPLNRLSGARPNSITPTASPGKRACESASAIKASRRSTMKALKKPFVNPMSAHARKARRMKSWCRGSMSQFMADAGKNRGFVRPGDVILSEDLFCVAVGNQFTVKEDDLVEKIQNVLEI